MTTTVACDFDFEAAHRLPHVPAGHRCARMHGHSYRVEVHVGGAVDPSRGWVVDFDAIEAAFAPLREALDHRVLNDVPGLDNPTSEMIAAWIWRHLAPSLAGLRRVVVHETRGARCTLEGPEGA